MSRGQARDLPGRVVDAVLQGDSTKLPAFIGVDLAEEGYVALRIDAVLPRDTQAEDAARLRAQYGQAWSSAETRAYLEALKTRYKADTSVASIAADTAASEPAR